MNIELLLLGIANLIFGLICILIIAKIVLRTDGEFSNIWKQLILILILIIIRGVIRLTYVFGYTTDIISIYLNAITDFIIVVCLLYIFSKSYNWIDGLAKSKTSKK